MVDDEVVTYAEVARWLPTDVRERIEVTRPCVDGGPHHWETRAVDVSCLSEAAPRELRWWYCTTPDCGVSVNTESDDCEERP